MTSPEFCRELHEVNLLASYLDSMNQEFRNRHEETAEEEEEEEGGREEPESEGASETSTLEPELAGHASEEEVAFTSLMVGLNRSEKGLHTPLEVIDELVA